MKKLRRQPNEGPATNEAPQRGDEFVHSPPPKEMSLSSDTPATNPGDETRQVLGKRKSQAKAEDHDENQGQNPPIQEELFEEDEGNGDNLSDQAGDLSVTIYNRSQLFSSDIVHLNDLLVHAESVGCVAEDLLEAAFHNWHTSRPVSETRPQVPSLHHFLRPIEHKATGDPVYCYGANSRRMPTANYREINGMKVPDYAVTVTEGRVKDAIAEIKENWRAWAEPRVKQHDVDGLFWMARHRSHEWYHKNSTIWSTGIPIYNKLKYLSLRSGLSEVVLACLRLDICEVRDIELWIHGTACQQ